MPCPLEKKPILEIKIKKRLQRSIAKDPAPQQDLAAISQRARLDSGLLTPSDAVQLHGVIGNRAMSELLGSSGQAPVIQRKMENLKIDKRLRWTYGMGRVNNWLAEVRGQVEAYNAIPEDDNDYQNQLQLLETIGNTAHHYGKEISSGGFLQKAGTLRNLGGPFRHPYYMLTRNLWKLSGTEEYTGQVPQEYHRVQEQAGLPQKDPDYLI